jgi:hypothetical protein
MRRRTFLHHAAVGAVVGTAAIAAGQSETPAAKAPAPKAPPAPPLAPDSVRDFVGACHRDLERVKGMLTAQPALVHGSWDWGKGDFETGLNAASHVGRRDLALLLLEQGARIDAFAAAMLGEKDIVRGLLRFAPKVAAVRGAHGYTLLYHAGYTGDVTLGEAIVAHLEPRHHDCNQALHSATIRGHTEFVAWLLKNGVDNPSWKTPNGATPLDLAVQRKHAGIEKLLRAAGGVAGTTP